MAPFLTPTAVTALSALGLSQLLAAGSPHTPLSMTRCRMGASSSLGAELPLGYDKPEPGVLAACPPSRASILVLLTAAQQQPRLDTHGQFHRSGPLMGFRVSPVFCIINTATKAPYISSKGGSRCGGLGGITLATRKRGLTTGTLKSRVASAALGDRRAKQGVPSNAGPLAGAAGEDHRWLGSSTVKARVSPRRWSLTARLGQPVSSHI